MSTKDQSINQSSARGRCLSRQSFSSKQIIQSTTALATKH